MSDTDERAIRELIERQFRSLSWSPESDAGWAEFAGDFMPAAPLYAAARPARSQTVDEFTSRMKQLAASTLPSLEETLRGYKISVFGNVAIALSVCELNENNAKTSRNVEAMLLIRDDGQWRIAAQAWDTETDDRPIPEDLLRTTT